MSGPLSHGNAVQTSPQKLVGQTHAGCHPIRGPPVPPQQILPIEILGQRLQRDGDVAQPLCAVCAVLQHVYAYVAEMIFGSQYPHIDIAQRYQLGSLVDIIRRRAVELLQALVQIDYDLLGRRCGKRSHRSRILVQPNTQVDVSTRPQSAFGVQSSDRPALDQQRLHISRPKQRDSLDDSALLTASLQSVEAVRLPKFVSSSGRA